MFLKKDKTMRKVKFFEVKSEIGAAACSKSLNRLKFLPRIIFYLNLRVAPMPKESKAF
jgi:hypothetical protein